MTSIWRRVFATSSGHVAAAARLPATKPAEKFAPRTLATVASSPIRPYILLLTCTHGREHEKQVKDWMMCRKEIKDTCILHGTGLENGSLTGSSVDQQIAEKGTSRASCAPRPVHKTR